LNTQDMAILIPARLDSKRLKNKLLIKFQNIEMIEVVRRKATLNSFRVPVYVVSGDQEIITLINDYGGSTITSKNDHESGLSRILECVQNVGFGKVLVLQGDEILIDPIMLDTFIKQMASRNFEVINGVTKTTNIMEINDINVVKCLVNNNNIITSIFRKSPLVSPNKIQSKHIKKILGIFAINKIENKFKVFNSELDYELQSVNTSIDVNICNKFISSNNRQKELFNAISR
jgi:3-deoxy-manno-octulosonate cytidylyltransferase (CMP-KDO synthetase)